MSKLIVVSNRLPVTLRKQDGEWTAAPSSGGLASAMAPILRQGGGVWIGSSGEEEALEPEHRDRLLNQDVEGYRHIAVDIEPDRALPGLIVRAQVKVSGKTGVEMEALTAVSVACLTLYDMGKALERGMRIEGIHLVEKAGGKSGHYRAARADGGRNKAKRTRAKQD